MSYLNVISVEMPYEGLIGCFIFGLKHCLLAVYVSPFCLATGIVVRDLSSLNLGLKRIISSRIQGFLNCLKQSTNIVTHSIWKLGFAVYFVNSNSCSTLTKSAKGYWSSGKANEYKEMIYATTSKNIQVCSYLYFKTVSHSPLNPLSYVISVDIVHG